MEVTAACCWHSTATADGWVWLLGPLLTYINPSSFTGLRVSKVQVERCLPSRPALLKLPHSTARGAESVARTSTHKHSCVPTFSLNYGQKDKREGKTPTKPEFAQVPPPLSGASQSPGAQPSLSDRARSHSSHWPEILHLPYQTSCQR